MFRKKVDFAKKKNQGKRRKNIGIKNIDFREKGKTENG